MDNYLHEGGLIQRGKMDKKKAWNEPALLLRWRFRTCSECETEFDIVEQGRFYKCGECA